jgi:hypothetical protein
MMMTARRENGKDQSLMLSLSAAAGQEQGQAWISFDDTKFCSKDFCQTLPGSSFK